MSRKIILNALVIGSLVIAGVVLWKVFSQPLPLPDAPSDSPAAMTPSQDAKYSFPELRVADETISPADLKWEFDLHTSLPQFEDSDEHLGIPKPNEAEKPEPIKITDGPELRERIITSVVERKVLFHFVRQKTKGAILDDPSRYQKCLSQHKEAIESKAEFFSQSKSRELLKTKLCEEDLVKQYLDEVIFKGITVTPEEVASYYRKHEKSYKKPLRVILRQIVTATETKAAELRKEIKPNNFAALARQNSISPEADNGGLMGPFSKEQLPTLFDIVFNMGIGEISGVIKSEYGFHILMPIERLSPQTQPLAEVSPAIRSELLRIKKLEVYQTWLNTAMNAISVSAPNAGVTP
jgi:hypothetical protein